MGGGEGGGQVGAMIAGEGEGEGSDMDGAAGGDANRTVPPPVIPKLLSMEEGRMAEMGAATKAAVLRHTGIVSGQQGTESDEKKLRQREPA